MNARISEYQITAKIYESSNSIVYRAILPKNNQPIILKVLKLDYPRLSELTKYKQEYEITRSLNLDGVIKVYGLHRYQNSLAIFLEDFGGDSLRVWMEKEQLALEEVLFIAVKIAEAMSSIHAANIIHKDINSSNIVYNRETRQIKIIDFGISTVLSQENQALGNPDYLEGTLAYISPEQTGRMNRSIDYRTDFYSLGVTLYELLTGQLPFQATDPIELVHCHIAKQATPPHLLVKEERCPKAVANIVMKLLAKTAEERYQTAWGLKVDLENCLHQLQTSGQILEFPLAAQDVSNKFQIPQKLYGREEKVAQLLSIFERVSQGITEMILVSGYSGIGKSALVNEVHKPIVQRRGYFISGKFDQLKRNIPYASLIQAFQDLIRQLLTESETRLENWKQQTLEALDPNSQIIIDVIPEVELIIGKQPPVPELKPSESESRFNLVLQKFIDVFAKQEHPLVIFLDDLQWADTASLKLIERLMTDTDSKYLLIIGAYRSNEVSPTHPLTITIETIQKTNAKVNSILLEPLNFNQVNQLTAETLKCSLEKSGDLAELINTKTNGNPFFINQLLQSLYAESLLSFDTTKYCWQWEIAAIKNVDITDNVVDLMVGKIEKLAHSTQTVLKLAACIGNQFNLDILSIVNSKSQAATSQELQLAIEEGLIIPLNNDYKIPLLWSPEEISSESNQSSERPSAFAFNYPKLIPYKFLHDRVQQAAYVLIPEDSKKEVHLRLGNLLLANTNTEELEENIFDIVNHLNMGSDIIDSQIEKDKLAELNLKSGIKAQASAAYQLALSYLQTAIELLNPNQSESPQNLQVPLSIQENPWERNYDLTLELYIKASETASFCANFEEVEKLTQIILQYAGNVLDKVKGYEIRLQTYFQGANNNGEEFIKQGLQALELLGIKISEKPNSKDLEIRLKQVKALWVNRNIEDLVAMPEMTDAKKQVAIQILFHMVSVASIEFPELYAFCILELVDLLLKNGNCSAASIVYTVYGIVLCGVENDIDAGYKFGKLGISLLESFNSKQFEVKVIYMFNTFINHYKKHIKKSLIHFLNTYQNGIETGDMSFGSLSPYMYCLHTYWAGKELLILEKEIIKYREAFYEYKYKQELGLRWLELGYQPVFNLLNKVENTHVLDNENYNEKMMLSFYKEVNDIQALCWFHINKIFICYLFHQYQEAIENATATEAYLSIAIGLYTVPIFYFYSSLSLLATFPNVTESESSEIFIKIAENQEKMALWASHAPMNFQHKFELVEAEKARVLGQNWEAQELYEKAIQGAKKYEFIQEEAIAYERAAKFYLDLGREEIGQLYLRNAYHCYSRWGAKAKVAALEAEYPHLQAITNRTRTNTISITSTGGSGEVLDLTTVIKASQALAGEIVLEKLLAKLMQFAIENAGAQKGYLILVNHNKLTIEAAREVGKNEVTVLQSLEVESTSILPQAIINYALRTQEDVVLDDATHQGLFIADPYIIQNQPKSVLCAPIINQGKLIGLLYLENNLTTDAFTSDRLELLRILSAQAAISIENALLYQTLEQKVEERTAQLAQANIEITKLNDRLKQENLRMSAELDITRELQQMILPKARELEQIPGLDIAGFMEPATEVGGDYYDVLNQDGRVKIGIGDVTGHGLESGVVMIMAQTAVRALLANQETNPVRFLNAVNRTIYDNVQRMNADKMLSLALLDYQDGTVRISGQHEEVILVRADGKLELIDTVDLGFPVGLESDIEPFINQLEIVLNPGDGIVLYTDGITEAENTDGNQYGLERLCEVVRQHYNLSATGIQQAIVEDVRAYIGEQEVFDDITLLVLKQK